MSAPAPKPAIDPENFIRENLPLRPVPDLPDIRLRRASPSSGLWRVAENGGDEGAAPYWAYEWAGGLALALHISRFPEIVAGRRVLDFGCGSGLVAIAAARAGAREVVALDSSPFAVAAARLNAADNGVTLQVELAAPGVDSDFGAELILAGDVFYNADVAAGATAFLDRCAAAGREVLVGDPERKDLPLHRVEKLAEYEVDDVARAASGAVFAWRPARV